MPLFCIALICLACRDGGGDLYARLAGHVALI